MNYTENDSLAGNFVKSLYVDSKGILWIGHNEGKLSYRKDGIFHKIESLKSNQPINDICEDNEGNLWFIDQKSGLCQVSSTFESRRIKYNWRAEGRLTFYSLLAVSSHEFLLGSSHGLYQVLLDDLNEIKTANLVQDIPQTRINRIIKQRNKENKHEYWVATDDQGFYHYSHDSQSAEHIINNELCLKFNIEKESILDIYEEKEGHLLLATFGNGVIKLIYDRVTGKYSENLNFSTTNGLKENNIKKILCDREGNYWFGSFTEGVFSLTQDHFIFYNLEEIGFKENKAFSVFKTEDALWMGLKMAC